MKSSSPGGESMSDLVPPETGPPQDDKSQLNYYQQCIKLLIILQRHLCPVLFED